MVEIRIPDYEQSAFKNFKEANGDITLWGEKDFEKAKSKIKNFRTCIDIGAHVGLTSLRYSQHFEHVHSFEPIVFDYIKDNLSDLDNVTLYNNAISDSCGWVDMMPNMVNSGASMIATEETLRRQRNSKRFAPIIRVRSLTIDSLNLKNVDFIKIDTEGYNVPVLEGMKETIKKYSPVIQIELSVHGGNDQMEKFMTRHGYVEYAKTSGRPIDKFYCKEK
mgnify:CR=1 FL=1